MFRFPYWREGTVLAYLPYLVGVSGFAPAQRSRFQQLLDGMQLPVILRDLVECRATAAAQPLSLIVVSAPATRASLIPVKKISPQAPIAVIGSDDSQAAAMDAIRAGADDYLCDRRCDAEIIDRLANLFAASRANCSYRENASSAESHGWVGSSAAAQRIWATAVKVAPSRSTVLIEGQTGVGKDVIALALHRLSNRASGPLVTMNCAAIPDALVEGELMGYRKGAFTGAVRSYDGKFRLAHGGTLFLDEVGELSLAAQAKILRVLESRQVCALGADKAVDVDVRIVAAANNNLERAVHEGRFRADLYYRLAVVRLNLPSLVERRADIAAIAAHLLQQIANDNGMGKPAMTPAVVKALEQHDWPGNVRELRNALEHAFVTAEDPALLHASDLPLHIQNDASVFFANQREQSTENERALLIEALIRHSGRKTEVARSLNCSRMTLYRRLERAGIDAATIATSVV
jgi:DNA-binding NtrC family response regulator